MDSPLAAGNNTQKCSWKTSGPPGSWGYVAAVSDCKEEFLGQVLTPEVVSYGSSPGR